jgi:WhiB family redox-sensing transcriptional regulator
MGALPLLEPEDLDVAWKADAACLGMDPSWWFPEHGQGVDRAIEVCTGCPVRTECRDYADAHRIRYGVWGGQTLQQRQAEKKKRRRKAA